MRAKESLSIAYTYLRTSEKALPDALSSVVSGANGP